MIMTGFDGQDDQDSAQENLNADDGQYVSDGSPEYGPDPEEQPVQAAGGEPSEEEEQFLKRKAKRKRKRMLWSGVRLAIAGVICIPLIFFCFWAGVKLFFPASSEVSGIKDKVARNADKGLSLSLEITHPEGRKLNLQRLDEENGAWVTECTYSTGDGESEKLKIDFPDAWTEHTYSEWRLTMDRAFGVKKYTSESIKVTCRNRGGVKLKCSAAAVYCVDNNEVLYNINMHKELPNASTTKMMTAILALENSNMDDVVEFSHRAVITPYAYMGVHTGYKFYMKDLMKAMLIMSANEAATAIGEHTGGTYEKFRDMMNKRARELGCKHTHFITPSGLDVYGHYSTAYDIALINAKAIEFDEYNKIMLMEKFLLKNLNKDDEWEYEVKTTNYLLKEKIKGYMGGKTGTTAQAGNCLSSAYKYKGKTYIIVVFNAGDRFKATKTLMKYVRKYA